MAARTLEGVVLRTRPYGESDKIVTLLTRSRGTVKAIAKGALRSQKRFGPILDLFAHLTVLAAEPRGSATLWRLDTATLLEGFAGLRGRYAAFVAGCHVLALAERLVPEGVEAPEFLDLVLDALRALDAAPPASALLCAVELRALTLAGFAPELDRCVVGGEAVPVGERVALSIIRGGVVCPACRPRAAGTTSVAGETISWLRTLRARPLAGAAAGDTSRPVCDTARGLLAAFLREHVGGPLPTLDALSGASL